MQIQRVALLGWLFTSCLTACLGGGTTNTLNTGGGDGGYILHTYVDGWPYAGFSSSSTYKIALDISATGSTGISDSTTIYSRAPSEGLPQADFDSNDGKLDYVVRGLSNGDTYSININTELTNYPDWLSCAPTSSHSTFPITGTTSTACDNAVCSHYIQCSYKPRGTITGLGSGKTVGLTVTKNSGTTLSLTDVSGTALDKTAMGNGAFYFASGLTRHETFSVTISTQPEGEHCVITNGSGEIPANTTDIAITCGKNYIFVNENGFTGSEVAPSAADTLCQNATELPEGYTAKALIVDGSTRYACTTASCSGGVSENHNWVLYPSTTYYRLEDDEIIGTTTSAGIFTFPLTNAMATSGFFSWTGLNDDWTSDTTNNCSTWTSASSGINGLYGDPGSTSSTVIDSAMTFTCDQRLGLLCVTQ